MLDFADQSRPQAPPGPRTLSTTLLMMETGREHILLALREADWVVGGPNGAAYWLGLKRTTLPAKMRKLGILGQHEGMAPN